MIIGKAGIAAFPDRPAERGGENPLRAGTRERN